MEIPPDKLAICLEVLQQISEDPSVIDTHERMKALIAKIHQKGKRGKRLALREAELSADRQLQAETAMVASRREQRPTATLREAEVPPVKTLNRPEHCYICKVPYTELHFFYHMLCPTCAAFNYAKRGQRADLGGRVALVTGGRLKIGYQSVLCMLRDGARVLVTTRFPRDAALRFQTEPDFDLWQDRLRIYGLDLRNLRAVEGFLEHLFESERWLDIIINNAAQTIKRPPSFYRSEQELECLPINTVPEAARRLIAQETTPSHAQLEGGSIRSEGLPELSDRSAPQTVDADGQPLDLRPVNSWALKLAEVSSVEMLEVQLVNSVAPFMLNSRLKPLLLNSPFARRFIVNVSAVEGQFNRDTKTPNHPHTNMAKAALNMMTRTSAVDYARDGIYMNSVDTGWITDENPHDKKVYLQETRGFYTPLDVIDGTARIYDPIVQGIEDPAEPLFGHFLKDYVPCAW